MKFHPTEANHLSNMTKKNNVLIITGVFIPEPVVSATILYDLAMELSKKHKVVVLRPRPTRPLGFKIPIIDVSNFPFKIVELESYTHPKSNLIGRFRESYSMGKHCVRFIKNNKSDIDLIYNAPWQLFGRYMIAKTANKFNIPFITPVQDIYPESIISKLQKWKFLHKYVIKLLLPYDKITLSLATIVHSISEKMKIYLIKTRDVDEKRFLVIKNWQNEDKFIKFRNKNSLENEDSTALFTFMYLGNIGPLAGLETLIAAFVKANIKNSLLVIAGSGSAKEKLIKQVTHTPQVKIEFWDVPEGEVPKTQAMANIMVLPVKKGFSSTSVPSKLPAYMFSAKPIIAAVDEDGDTAQSILDSECGWLCEPENVDMLAELMILSHATKKNKLKHMGEMGYEYALKYFSRKNNLQKLSRACDNILLHKTEK